ncbi:flagellar hook-length control protein [Herminiimonas sp. KBW02]|nr:flagellar hook-length control protein [Herminiimonas sp. KBW02]
MLAGLLMLMCASSFLTAGVLWFGQAEDVSVVVRGTLAAICMACGSYVFFRTLKNRKIYKIHISGSGQIRLASVLEGSGGELGEGELVELLPDSTLWPGLLLLRLQNAARQTHNVVILPDSLAAESFRALMVACRWIVMRHADADKQPASGI